jgi:RHS repeat-associated protein
LLRVVPPSGPTIDYVIDARSRRVGKKVGGTLVQGFLYRDRLKPVVELDGAGNVVSRFVYGSSRFTPDYLVKAGTTYRVLSDHLGSVRLVINTASGVVAQRMDYDEWGNVAVDTAPGFQPFGYAGGLYDRDTGLVRFGVRDYDPATGRWTAKEPLRFKGSINFFTYAANDPINHIDPSGRSWMDPTYGLPKAFWNWFHSPDGEFFGKGREHYDATEEEAREAYEEWLNQGSPNPRQSYSREPSQNVCEDPWDAEPPDEDLVVDDPQPKKEPSKRVYNGFPVDEDGNTIYPPIFFPFFPPLPVFSPAPGWIPVPAY